MARVAFFVESLPPTTDLIARFAFGLARSLAEQSQEMLLLSTFRPGHSDPPRHRNLAVAFPFRDWSWVEAARALPALTRFQPDIVHFIQPHGEALEGWTNAMVLLPSLVNAAARAQRRPAPSVVTSYFDLSRDWRRKQRPVLAQSHAVTASTENQLSALLDECPSHAKPLAALTPLGLLNDETDVSPPTSTDGIGATAGQELVLVPGDVDAHVDPARLFRLGARLLQRRPNALLAVLGGWGTTPPRTRFALLRHLPRGLEGRFRLLGAHSPAERAPAFARASLVFAPTLGRESLTLAEAKGEALRHSVSFLGVEDSDPKLLMAALRALDSAPGRAKDAAGGDESRPRRELVDTPANVVSRLYAQVHQLRGV